jgi:DNA uptake protein ComE-like DNA-binding protein
MKRIRLLLAVLAGIALFAGAVPSYAQPKKTDAVKAVKGEVKKAEEAGAKLIDINSATADELKSIPGIGEAYSKKIIAGRPYRAKNELKDKGILPDGVYEKVKDRIIAKQK